jgi:hypothetical protein
MTGRRAVVTVAAVTVVAVVLAVVVTAAGGGTGATTSHHVKRKTTVAPPPPVVVDTAATPAGWVPVADGDVQLSVPADWYVTGDGCVAPTAPGTIVLSAPEVASPVPGRVPSPCFPTTTAAPDAPVVSVGPIASSVPARSPPPVMINGITVDVAGETACTATGPCPTWYVVPALGVEIIDDEVPGGPRPVIDTLTRSPRAVALAPGPAPQVPAWWHRVSFGGISASVPTAWPVQDTSNWSSGCAYSDIVMAETAVTLDSGITSILPSCPEESSGGQPFPAPVNGLLIDPGRDGPLVPGTRFSACLRWDRLTVCPSVSDDDGILVAAVHRPGTAQPVALEIGLAGSGVTARTILRSLRLG